MNNQDIQNKIEELTQQVQQLERISIQVNMDPVTTIYLNKILNTLVANILTTYPTQTYSTLSPSGIAPTGSIWMEDTGVLATRKIHVYSGSAWVQMK